MKKIILKWFQDILGITELQRQLRIETENRITTSNKVDSTRIKLDSLINTINVGVDIHEDRHNNTRNWAIIVINGKSEYIKLFDFSSNDIRYVQDFLRNFRERNVTIDRRPGIPRGIFFK